MNGLIQAYPVQVLLTPNPTSCMEQHVLPKRGEVSKTKIAHL